MTLEQQEPPTHSLADELLALPPTIRKSKNPLISNPTLATEWVKVKELLLAGKLKHLSFKDIRLYINQKYNTKLSEATFCRFLATEGITKQSE
jgi:hypothetical protein